jgi:hypothetical protein
MLKNTAGQKWIVFAMTVSTGLAKTGDAAQITGKLSKDGAAGAAITDTNPTELESGYYAFDLTQAETNYATLSIIPVSSTSGVGVMGVPGSVWPDAVLTDTTAILADTNELQTNQGNWLTATGFATPTNITAGTITTATNLTNNHAKYMHGAVWIDSVNGAAGTTAWTNGIMTNPVTTLTDAKNIGDGLKIRRYWIQAGSNLTLAAAFVGYVFTGKGYILALGGQDISKAQIEGVEGLSGTGICTTGEAVINDCHVVAVTIGEADFNRCHLNGQITQSQATVPYLYHSCVGIGNLAKIIFAAANQSAVVAKWSGSLIIAGMVSTNTLFIDGNGEVTIDNTNNTGTVYISGNITLINNGTTMHIHDSSRFDEDQTIATVTNLTNLPAVTTDWLTAAGVKADAVTKIQVGLATSSAVATIAGEVTSILEDTGTTLDALIKDVPTVAEFEARSLVAADYTIVSDLGTVQTGDSYAIVNGVKGIVDIHDTMALDATVSKPATAQTITAPADMALNSTVAKELTLTAAATQASEANAHAHAIDLVTAKLDTTLVADGPVSQFTANALELSPAGGAAPTAEQVADAVWDELIAGHAGAGSTGAKLTSAAAAGDPWSTPLPGAYLTTEAGGILSAVKTKTDTLGGAGAVTWTYTLTDSGSGAPIDGAEVWISTDSAGSNIIATGTTNSSGIASFTLDAGTVFVWRKKAGYNFSPQPDQETVS